eukprot:scaffold84740_cov75-Phaeocystis_antarctica.AAC.7
MPPSPRSLRWPCRQDGGAWRQRSACLRSSRGAGAGCLPSACHEAPSGSPSSVRVPSGRPHPRSTPARRAQPPPAAAVVPARTARSTRWRRGRSGRSSARWRAPSLPTSGRRGRTAQSARGTRRGARPPTDTSSCESGRSAAAPPRRCSAAARACWATQTVVAVTPLRYATAAALARGRSRPCCGP